MSDPILSVRNLGINFGGLKAVQNFSLDLHHGELVGLIGPNGAGKTTVFNLLTGVYTPTEGDIFMNGTRINGLSPHKVVACGIARTFQNIRLFKEMTVLDNVKVSFTRTANYGFADALFRTRRFRDAENQMDSVARGLLKLFSLEDLADELAGNLPYGRQRKLEIARALGTGMQVLLLDEPAAGMNPAETAELLECINVIREKFKVAILLIEHDMSLVMNICERIIVLDYGQPIASGLPEEIKANPQVIAAYLGEQEDASC